ncbi:FecR family protein [Brucellaceae bacterium C25G]
MEPVRDDKAETSRSEALAWFVTMNSGDATDADKAAHTAWLARNPENKSEYQSLDLLWTDLDKIEDPRKAAKAQNNAEVLHFKPKKTTSRRAFLTGGAAIAASAAALYVVKPDFLNSDYSTATGEIRNITLEDGTNVDLDADTAIAVDYSNNIRLIKLLRGRAFFNVAKDTTRPFTVEAAGGSITALGTRFVVHQWADDVTVWVEESAVSVIAPNKSERVVHSSELTSYNEQGFGALDQVDAHVEAAWKRGKLIFEDKPLRQVLADLNRYRRGTIRATDSKLLNLRVSGIFDIKNPDGVLDVIKSTLPIRSRELTSYLVFLSPA